MVTSHLQHSALLSLGAMAGLLTQQNRDPALANEIVDILGSILDHVTGHASSSRLRREINADSVDLDHPLLRATVLDSIGNSGAERLFPRLVDHVTGPGSLAAKHAAVKAISRYNSAEVRPLCNSHMLLDIVVVMLLILLYCCLFAIELYLCAICGETPPPPPSLPSSTVYDINVVSKFSNGY